MFDQLDLEGVDDSCVLGNRLPYDDDRFVGKTSVLVGCMFHWGMGDEEDEDGQHLCNF